MVMTDPIADFLTRIRNANMVMHEKVEIPASKTKIALAEILKNEGFIKDYEQIEGLIRTTGAAFCVSGAGPTLLCITRNPGLEEKLAKKLDDITEASWQMIPLHIEFQGAHVISEE